MTATAETLVREALHRATDDLAAPVHRLTEASARGGRRLRRRRRLVAAAGALGTAVLVTVPAAVTLGGSSPMAAPVATDPDTSTTSPAPVNEETSRPAPPPLADAALWTQMPATAMLTVLADHLLPRGMSLTDAVVTNDGRAPGEPERIMKGWLQADLVEDGGTVGGINVMLMAPGEPTSRYTCPGNLVDPDACTEITNGAGTTFGRQSKTITGDVTVLEVVLRGPGDGLVYVAVSNSADDKWGAGSIVASDTVPLTLDQVTDIAANELWTDWEPPARSRN